MKRKDYTQLCKQNICFIEEKRICFVLCRKKCIDCKINKNYKTLTGLNLSEVI